MKIQSEDLFLIKSFRQPAFGGKAIITRAKPQITGTGKKPKTIHDFTLF